MFTRIARATTKLLTATATLGLMAAGFAAAPVSASEAQAAAAPVAVASLSVAQKRTIEVRVENELFALTNKTRQRIGVKPLKRDYLLTKSTRAWSGRMGSMNSMVHSTTYPFPARTEYAGENILRAPASASSAAMQKAWEASPTHWANLAAAKYDYVGFGAQVDHRGNVWVTAHFLGDKNGDYTAQVDPNSAAGKKAAAAQKAAQAKKAAAAKKVAAAARSGFNTQLGKQQSAVTAAKNAATRLSGAAKKSGKLRKAVAAMAAYRAYTTKNTPKITSRSSTGIVKKGTSVMKTRTATLAALTRTAQRLAK